MLAVGGNLDFAPSFQDRGYVPGIYHDAANMAPNNMLLQQLQQNQQQGQQNSYGQDMAAQSMGLMTPHAQAAAPPAAHPGRRNALSDLLSQYYGG